MKAKEIKNAVFSANEKALANSVHHRPIKGESFSHKGVSFQARVALIMNPKSKRETFIGGMQESYDLIITVDGERMRVEMKQGESTIASAFPEKGLPLNAFFTLRRKKETVAVRCGMLARSRYVIYSPCFESEFNDEWIVDNSYVIPVSDFWEFCSETRGICGYRDSRGIVQIQPIATNKNSAPALARMLNFCEQYETLSDFMLNHKICCNNFEYHTFID